MNPVLARRDVESMLLLDVLPENVRAVYASERGTFEVDLSLSLSILQELRYKVVRTIVATAEENGPPFDPFTVLEAYEALQNRDFILDALLVHEECIPLVRHIPGALYGMRLKLFGHTDVPFGNIYALAPPEFCGVIPQQNLLRGVAITNPRAITWGFFRHL
jgi:hypothetical protein